MTEPEISPNMIIRIAAKGDGVTADGRCSTTSQTLLISWGKAGCITPTPSTELGNPEVTDRISMPGKVSRNTW